MAVILGVSAPAALADGFNYGPDTPYHGNTWVNAWNTGHVANPIDTVAYKAHIFANVQYGTDYKIDNVYKKIYVDDLSTFSDNKGVVDKSDKIVDCVVRGLKRNNACYVGYRKWHIVIDQPGIIPTTQCYPWVKVKVSSWHEIADVFVDTGSNSGTFC